MSSFQPDTLDALELASPAGSRKLRRFAEDAVLLGKGGAGSVYAHPEIPGEALKIYHTPERADAHAAKVQAMLATPPREVRTPEGTVQIAWPSAMVLRRGEFIGFSMPRVEFAHAWTLQQLIQPTQRARRHIPERLDLRLYAGLNLATVLFALHEIGHYVIDLKPQNVLVYRDDTGSSAAHVALVDCDGFQVRGPSGRRFDAELATAQFLHPEVATQTGGDVSFDLRRINDKARLQDDFALAIILFQLLNDGLHPMMGRETGKFSLPSDLAARLQAGGRYYAYGTAGPSDAILPDEDSLHHWFDPSLRELFDRAFCGGMQPPLPRDWAVVLGRLAAEERQCGADPDHWMLGATCGLCARAADRKRLGRVAPAQLALPPQPQAPAGRKLSAVAAKAPRLRTSIGRALRRVAMLCVLQAMVVLGTQLPLLSTGQSLWRAAEREYFWTDAQKEAARLVENYFRNRTYTEKSAIGFYLVALAPQMNFRGVSIRRADVLDAMARFDERWPTRKYYPHGDSLNATCQGIHCQVRVVVDWDTTSDTRRAHAAGQTEYMFDVNLAGATPVLTGQVDKEIERWY